MEVYERFTAPLFSPQGITLEEFYIDGTKWFTTIRVKPQKQAEKFSVMATASQIKEHGVEKIYEVLTDAKMLVEDFS